MKTRRYAIWYVPRKKRFAVVPLKKDEMINPRSKGVSIMRASTPSKALTKLSRKSYHLETRRRLK